MRAWGGRMIAVAHFVAGGAIAVAALSLVPASTSSVGPATISARTSMGTGQTRLVIPPLGTVSADTHPAPVELILSVGEVDLVSLGRNLVDAQARSALAQAIEEDLRSLGVRLLVRSIIGGAALGGIAVALLPGRTRVRVLLGAAGGAATIGLVIGISAATFDVEAFQEPRFTGTLTRAPVVIEAVRAGEITFPEVRSRYETAARRLSGLIAILARPDPDPRDDAVAILHISDVHSNPLGLEIARQLALRFDVDAVLDTGDLMSYGLPIESSIGNLVEQIDKPYLFVPGNHDSASARAAIAGVENVTLLDGSVAEVEGLRILGFGDPTYTNWNSIPVEEADRIRVEQGEELVDQVVAAAADVLAVHDARLAQASFGTVPLVMAGHDHKEGIEEHDGTLVLRTDSMGATGLKSFTVESEKAYEAQIVYFLDGRAIALDYVRFEGLGENFEVERKTLPLP